MSDQPAKVDSKNTVPLGRDTAFHAMTSTQFLGAFNDNLFKQLVLLLCVDLKASTNGQTDYQPVALALFAIPFVLFSGFAGYLSDKHSKRTIIVISKIAEIVVMLTAMVVFFKGGSLTTLLQLLFVVLFLMSMQSAFFGPSKYGILPELFRKKDLPAANGMIQMTTFVAIIFGMALAGYARDWASSETVTNGIDPRMWIPFAICVGIAVIGTVTSWFVRRTPVAHPGLKFEVSALWANRETRQLLWNDRPLLSVLLVSSLFWFVGAIVQTAVNEYGLLHLQLSYSRTSLMAACMGVGIAIGCLWAGKLSKHWPAARIVTCGALGITATLIGLIVIGWNPTIVKDDAQDGLLTMMYSASPVEWLSRLDLIVLGIAAGWFVVPMQVVLQSRPPEHLKGRMIGTLNLVNWIAIVIAALFLGVALKTLQANELPMIWIFALLAAVMLPIGLFFKLPANESS